jgi:hypothetical protein
LTIASKVQRGGKHVTTDDVELARAAGATDEETHDTVLIAAAFCMYNRDVDGLATWTPTDPNLYDEMGRRMAREGYVRSSEESRITPLASRNVSLRPGWLAPARARTGT